jgi:hypothetical protein|tara:strand:- start:392 stop:664 length:273 start_codon:yes stop_codon:yes gene_type:complete
MFPCFCSANTLNSVCLPDIIGNADADLTEKLKICDPGNRVLIKYKQNLNPEFLITNLCDLRYSIIYDHEKKIINTRDKSNVIVCIYLPKN